MARRPTYNILMYSHDTYGLGHIRRTMAIASNLHGPDVNILILTGSPIAGRFSFPEQVDFVRIPGMIKKTNDEYQPLSIRINPKHALDIRKNIITATAKAFRPHLFIVDKEPLGLKKEVLPTLQWLRRCLPESRTILGLRDIMDDGPVVRRDWREKGVYRILDELYSEIWVYGQRDLYDPIREYAIPEEICRKMFFTGYIPRRTPGHEAVKRTRREHMSNGNGRNKLVVVTTGGGGDGYAVMDAYLSMLEKEPMAVKSVLVTGPFMPKEQRRNIFRRARRLGVRTYHFYRQMEKLLAAADLVISMGGYNTICEILSQKTVSLVIPREAPRKEQLRRARAMANRHLVDYLPWARLSPEALRPKVHALLETPQRCLDAVCNFRLTGIEVMCQRLMGFRDLVC